MLLLKLSTTNSLEKQGPDIAVPIDAQINQFKIQEKAVVLSSNAAQDLLIKYRALRPFIYLGRFDETFFLSCGLSVRLANSIRRLPSM